MYRLIAISFAQLPGNNCRNYCEHCNDTRSKDEEHAAIAGTSFPAISIQIFFVPTPTEKKRQPLRITSSNHGVFRRNREGRFSSLTRKIFSYPNNELAIHFFYEIDCLHIHCNKLFFHANRNCCTHFFQTKIATQLIVGTNRIIRNNQQGIREHGNIKNLA